MAVVKLYKIKVDLVSYARDRNFEYVKTTQEKYKNPIYSPSLVRASMLRSQYGSEYVDVQYTEIDDSAWEKVDWEKLNELV